MAQNAATNGRRLDPTTSLSGEVNGIPVAPTVHQIPPVSTLHALHKPVIIAANGVIS